MCKLPVSESLKDNESTMIHKFELAGLGKAPFVFIGFSESVHNNGDGTTKAGSSCDYCATSIRYVFWCRSADGKEFKVGCDCIHKVGGAGLIRMISKAERELKDAKNKVIRERKAANKIAKLEAARKNISKVAGLLASKPHPNKFYANEGKTLFHYVKWNLDNGNELGACYVERALNGKL